MIFQIVFGRREKMERKERGGGIREKILTFNCLVGVKSGRKY